MTNPYAGMGLASGIFDAASLSDVLISILHRNAAESILDHWATARRDAFTQVADPASLAALRRCQSADPDNLVQTDPMLRALKAGLPVPMPAIGTDVTALPGFVCAAL